jgi:hypothetical protein
MSRHERRRVVSALQAYEAVWTRHHAAAVSSFSYEPAMRVAPGGPIVRPTRSDQEAFFNGFLRALVGRGYAGADGKS